MKAVIIGASGEALHTIRTAKEQGLVVTAIDGNPEAAGLKEADEAFVINISDEEESIQEVKKIQPDFLLTVPIGRYLTTTGAVNDALGLPGISRQEAQNCTDKWLFHQLLNQKGLRKTACYLLSDKKMVKDLYAHRGKMHYPVILKPRYGSGSRGIFVVRQQEELKEALDQISKENVENNKITDDIYLRKRKSDEDYILEECVEGEEYGIDGAIIQGKLYLVLLRKKENTPLPARQAVAYFCVPPEDEFFQQVREWLKKAVEALGLEECLLHGDIIRTADDPFIIELSARPSGHNLHNLFTPLATGIDMAKEYICYRMGKDYSFSPLTTKRMMIHYFDLEGRVKRIPHEGEVEKLAEENGGRLVKWQCNIEPGERLSKVSDGHSLMGRGYFILEGRAEKELKIMAEKVKSLFQ